MRYFQIISIIAVILIGGIAVLFFREAYIGKSGETVAFNINEGDDAADIALRLEQADIVSDGSRYLLYGNVDRSIFHAKTGAYHVKQHERFRKIARQFAIGPIRNEAVIRLIEGWTIDDIIELLARDHAIDPVKSAEFAGRSLNEQSFSEVLREEYTFLRDLPRDRSLEGYLFPDTYHVWEDELPKGLMYKQLNEFNRQFGNVEISQKLSPLETLDDVIILASIVEREVPRTEDRKIIAGIFLNRLKLGMRLQSDATISYLTGSGRARSTDADLAIDSQFNTYRYGGLPPSPIGNPSASAIQAVLFPEKTNYHYFLTTEEGEILYARTFEEHGQNRIRAGY